MHEQGCVRSIATSAAAAPRRYSQVAEWLSRAQDTSKPPWSTAGQQHAREQVVSRSMDCARAHGLGSGAARTIIASKVCASAREGCELKLWVTLCIQAANLSIEASAHELDTKGVRAAPRAIDRNIVPSGKNGSRRGHVKQRRTHRRSAQRKGANGCPMAQDAVV